MNYAVASAQTYCTGVKLLEQLHYVVRFIKSLRRRVSQRPGCKRQRFFAIFSLLTLFVPSLLLPLRATLSSSFTGRLTKAHVAARSKEDWEAEPATVVARLVFEMCCSAHSIYTKWIRSYWQPISQWCTHANSIWHPCASNCFFYTVKDVGFTSCQDGSESLCEACRRQAPGGGAHTKRISVSWQYRSAETH